MMGRCVERALPVVVMVLVVLTQVINLIVSKMAMSRGLNFFILVLYADLLSTLISLPFAFIFSRSNNCPVTFAVLCKIFLLALVGCVVQICEYAGTNYGSPTLATAMMNLIPGFTFVLALILRMETVNWRSLSSHAKTIGTLVSIAGAFVLTFYNGPPILNKPTLLFLSSKQDWILGAFLLVITALSNAIWYISQAAILKVYPAKMMILCFIFLFSTIQSALVSLVTVRDWTAWKINPDITLFAVFYTGCSTAFRVYLISWCIEKEGPLFVSMFKPLAIVVAAVVGVIWFSDTLYLGSIIGGVIIVVGFYAVTWGKFKENISEVETLGNSASSTPNAPLLQVHTQN
ncbi:PREDICTED: WAT1-related protein At3g28050-like isoform X3 [Ipomoea nil]|uniref:WAT1-related protein At3g28050-like isoform X3 n=1 Tax=Ipomoea nil TaxID=35883 RepID=UPI000901F09D|nr:PREDICTED: WAT1-related protein At3g28050-like isoform X3 [Ipomoea nil]